MINEQLDADQAICDKATDGPWTANIEPGDVTIWADVDFVGNVGKPVQRVDVAFDLDERNGKFIAAARTQWPAAIAEVRRLREALSFYAHHAKYSTNGCCRIVIYARGPNDPPGNRLDQDNGEIARVFLADTQATP